MKRSFLNIVLPAFAIIMAVGLAFATEEDNSTQTGYYLHPIWGLQTVQTDCEDVGNTHCMEGQFQVFKNPGLTIALYEKE